MSNDSTIREYTLSLNEFNKPKILTNEDATCVKIMELILLEKGTYPTRPDMGVGIVSRYRYSYSDSAEQLKGDIATQIDTYLPELSATEITIKYSDMAIYIYITVDEVVYSLTFNKETTTLDSL
jgi:hypothetical protein